MKMHEQTEVTTYLNGKESLCPMIEAQLQKLIYTDLKHIAMNRLACESSNNTMTVTTLVHEAYLKLRQVDSMVWQSRRHYFGAAAEAMRRILIDRARYHLRQRREGDKLTIELDEGLTLVGIKPKILIALDDALTDLENIDSNLADLVKLNYFAGLPLRKIAKLYNKPTRSIARKVETARAWLLIQVENK